MERLIGTIINEAGSLVGLVHNSDDGTFVGRQSGKDDEPLGDWNGSTDPLDAWRAARSWYHTPLSYRDSWVLCLRPIEALSEGHSETRLEP